MLAPSVDLFATEKCIFCQTHANNVPPVILEPGTLKEEPCDRLYTVNDIFGHTATSKNQKGRMVKIVAATILFELCNLGNHVAWSDGDLYLLEEYSRMSRST